MRGDYQFCTQPFSPRFQEKIEIVVAKTNDPAVGQKYIAMNTQVQRIRKFDEEFLPYQMQQLLQKKC